MARRAKAKDRNFEDLSSYSSASGHQKPRKARTGSIALKIVVIAFCSLLVITGGILIYISTDLLEGLTTTSITKDPEELGIDINNENIVRDESIKNIALFGVDSRSDSFEGQSDVIMILTVDNKHNKLKMTSILRDSKVPIEGETLQGEYMNWDTKINAAYAYGGPELAIRTLNQNFGLDITDYVTINFANMAAIVDAFGGVDMAVTAEEVREINKNLWALSQEVLDKIQEDQAEGVYEESKYPLILHDDYIPDASGNYVIDSGNFVGGTYHLNGNQAVAYGRIRAIDNDFERAHRQQMVLRALLGKIRRVSFSDYPGIIKQMMPYCETSLDLGDVVNLAAILTGDLAVESINVPNAAYETDLFSGTVDNVWYYIYDVTKAAERVSAFIYEEMSPYWALYGSTAEDSEARLRQ